MQTCPKIKKLLSDWTAGDLKRFILTHKWHLNNEKDRILHRNMRSLYQFVPGLFISRGRYFDEFEFEHQYGIRWDNTLEAIWTVSQLRRNGHFPFIAFFHKL